MTPASKALDQYFTPPKLAAELIEAVTIENPLLVGDFAAGDGELLKAAIKRWPDTQCVAIDIDHHVIELLTENQPSWLVACADFLDNDERQNLTVLKEREKSFPLIILNPPFSCRGGTMRWTNIGGTKTHCSPALAFIVSAAAYLQEGGQLVAIVPYGLIQGEKDEIARDLLRRYYGFEVIETYANGGFAKCSPRTAIIRLTAGYSTYHKPDVSSSPLKRIFKADSSTVSIQRGRIPNNNPNIENTQNGLPFIHTTNLQNNKIVGLFRFAGNNLERFRGPGILLPRVGRPKVEKIVLLESESEFVISECLFMIECVSKNDAYLVYRCLIDNWASFKESHGGTCATFITIQSLSVFLENTGFTVLGKKASVRTYTYASSDGPVKKAVGSFNSNTNKPLNAESLFHIQL
ncbi:methyltransferase [Hymenobacter sp. BT523]|uniref:methyltransferase n=1 Tax=Hymenobacter sp. BT523 TaxID=2795725 RepID=UPI0018EB9C69|nr:methyltransferase [Hymenobacter sp. BT523]MBJ6111253.1 methyltransferase [Hymenobacter sp. BT523]